MSRPDAIVVGSGPNGLSAAITLARAGVSVVVLEAEPSIGGGSRSAELTLPGFIHDLCSAIHPFAYASPFFRSLPLQKYGVEWVHSPAPLAHPFEDGSSIVAGHSLGEMRKSLGSDGPVYAELLQPARRAWRALTEQPLPQALIQALPAVGVGVKAIQPVASFTRHHFSRPQTRAFFAGAAGHSLLPLEKAGTTGIALGLLTAAHTGGWPFPRGGAQKIADALADGLRSLGGRIETGCRVRDVREVLRARAVLLDVTPQQLLKMAGPLLPRGYALLLRRFKRAVGVFKMDWALSEPVPWRSAEIKRAAAIHIGGTLEELAAAERAPWDNKISERPFIIAAQHTLFDSTRAPRGKHTLWGYCHVPLGSEVNMVERMEAQIERFAPGFRDCILARSALGPRHLQAHNANLVGGDITGGMQDIWQSLVRPTLRYWATPLPNVYLCSSSTPPGVGVHGMCGHWAAMLALQRNFK